MKRISPTRMNLLLKKDERKQVALGNELLRNKRDVLVKEFFDRLKTLSLMRKELEELSKEAMKSLILSFGYDGQETLNSLSLLREKDLIVDIEEKNLWGVKVPELKNKVRIPPLPFSETSLSLHAQDTREKFIEFIQLSIEVLVNEITLIRLGQEIKKTSRKVNHLEKHIGPLISRQIKFIRETLDELEQEDIFRLKMQKKKKNA